MKFKKLTDEIKPELDVTRRRLLEVHPASVWSSILEQELYMSEIEGW